MARRYFEFVEGTSSKFWEVWVEANEVRTRYGKIGAAGQTTVKDEGSAAAAQKLHDKLVREKTGKGYEEKSRGATGPSSERVTAPMEATPAAKAAPAKAVPAKAAEPEAEDEEEAAGAEGFRRWENTEEGASKFWEIKIDEAEHTVRFGKIGTEGQSKTKEFYDEGEAEDDAKKLIAEKTKKGYRPVGKHTTGPDLGPTNPELEAKIASDLADASGYLVYADWLSGQGDPRGELIVLQHQAAEAGEPKAKELKKAADALIKKHGKRLLGTLASFDDDEKKLELDWELGFIHTARMSWPMFDDGEGADRKAAKELAALLDLPAARFLRGLSLGPCPGEEELSFQPMVDVLEEKKPAHLEELYLGEIGDWDISSTSTGDFGALAKILKTLRKVTLRGGDIGFGKDVALPELVHLTIETGSLTQAQIKAICAMKCPKLEKLSIWFGSKNYGASGGLKDIAPILAATGLPKLKHLGIMNCEFVNEVAAALPGSKVLKQLTSLDLSKGCLSDSSIDAMIASKAFGHLEELNVDDNGLTDASKPKVKALAKKANFGTKQDPERAAEGHYRYCSVGE